MKTKSGLVSIVAAIVVAGASVLAAANSAQAQTVVHVRTADLKPADTANVQIVPAAHGYYHTYYRAPYGAYYRAPYRAYYGGAYSAWYGNPYSFYPGYGYYGYGYSPYYYGPSYSAYYAPYGYYAPGYVAPRVGIGIGIGIGRGRFYW